MMRFPVRVCRLVSFATVLFGALAIFGTNGCEVIVGDTLPATLSCSGTGTAGCPMNQGCGPSGQCVPCITLGLSAACGPIFVTDAGHDAGHDAGMDAHVVVDAGHEAAKEASAPETAPAGLVGDPCASSTSCSGTLICISSGDLEGLSLTQNSVCSKPCCTDSDCGGTNVCYPTRGGNYCVTATVARGCGTSCPTACCASSQCSGQACAISSTSNGFVASCQPSGNGATGDSCASDMDCKNGVCACDTSGFNCNCVDTCCSSSSCSGTGGANTCEWLLATDPNSAMIVFRGCNPPAGNTKSGQACSLDATAGNDCAGSICATFPGMTTKLCTQPCCQDSDCAAIAGGWICAPNQQMVGVGNIDVLVCQPKR